MDETLNINWAEYYSSRIKGAKIKGKNLIGICPFHDDKKPSFSANIETGQCKCFSGCINGNGISFHAKLNNMDNKEAFKDLLKISGQFKTPEELKQRRITATYNYCNIDGELIYQVLRYEPKDFIQRRPDKNKPGQWIYNMQGVKRVLYNLPGVYKAKLNGHTVIIVEGEKDVDNLTKLGFAATTNVGGAGKWSKSYTETLKGANTIAIIPDNDKPGKEHAESIAIELFGYVPNVKILTLEGIPVKGDISDWIEQGHTAEELLQLINGTPNWEQKAPIADIQANYDLGSFLNNDLGNSNRLIKMYGKDIKYCFDWNSWLIWDGIHWQTDKTKVIVKLAKNVLSQMQYEGMAYGDEALEKFAFKSGSLKSINSMIELATSELSVLQEELDKDNYLLSCKNSTINLKNFDTTEHDRDNLITKYLDFNYDPEATAPTWKKFICDIMGGDMEMVEFLQRAIGYSLTGDTSEDCIFILHGVGSNGKSTFVDTIAEMLGSYARTINPESLMVKDRNSPNTEIAKLKGARFVDTSESDEGRRLSEGVIKQLTGGGEVSTRFLFGHDFEYTPTYKIWFSTNHKPVIRGTDFGIWRRICLIPFDVIFTEEQQDKSLPEKLINELPGIFNWALEGLNIWNKKGLQRPQKVIASTQEYRNENDVIQRFIDDCCLIKPGKATLAKNIIDRYTKWCRDNGEEVMSTNMFGRRMQEKGIKKDKPGGKLFYYDLVLVAEDFEEVDENPFQNVIPFK